jgi:hypothetical protein
MLDKDGNGQLSREEYEAGFDRFSVDQDGVLLKSEFMAWFACTAFQDRYVPWSWGMVALNKISRIVFAGLRYVFC